MKKRKPTVVPEEMMNMLSKELYEFSLKKIDDQILEIVNEYNIPKQQILDILAVISRSYKESEYENLEWELDDLMNDVVVKDVISNYLIDKNEKPFSEN